MKITLSRDEVAMARRMVDQRLAELRETGYPFEILEDFGPFMLVSLCLDAESYFTAAIDPLRLMSRLAPLELPPEEPKRPRLEVVK